MGALKTGWHIEWKPNNLVAVTHYNLVLLGALTDEASLRGVYISGVGAYAWTPVSGQGPVLLFVLGLLPPFSRWPERALLNLQTGRRGRVFPTFDRTLTT